MATSGWCFSTSATPSGAATMQISRIDLRAGLLQQVERRHRAAAGGEHRIDHEHVALVQPRGQLRIVLRRDRRQLIALKADVTDPRARHQLQHRVEHPQARTQHRHDDDVRSGAPARRRAERRLDGDGLRRQILQRLRDQQHADPRRGATEMLGCGGLVAQRGERIMGQRVVDEVDGHPVTIQGAGDWGLGAGDWGLGTGD